MRNKKYILIGLLILVVIIALLVTVTHKKPTRSAVNIWYVDATNGSSRYDATVNTGGICNGHGPNPPVGNTPNQDCPFADLRYLQFNGQYTTNYQPWIIQGGDVVHIAPGQYRVGYETGESNGYILPSGYAVAIAGNPFASGLATPPSGTAAQHTQFIGAGSGQTEIHAGYGAWAVMDIGGVSFVDFSGMEMTRHSQCVIFGVPPIPNACSSSTPVDDYAKNGLSTNNGTHDILLQDINIHGFVSRGIIGPIGGTITANNVRIAYNGGAGWDFDDGNSTPSINAVLDANGLVIEWNGCNQAYPGPGAISCYGQSTGGYGDGIGTPTGTCVSGTVTNSIFRYNTQDGYDMLHNDTGNCKQTVSNSMAYGNNGQQFKWGNANNGSTLTNSTIVANCNRLSEAFPNQPPGYNANLQDFCRAGDAIALNFSQGTHMTLDHDTIITSAPVTLDIACVDATSCSNSSLTFKNSIVLGYSDPAYSYNGHGAPAGWCLQGCNSSTLPLGTLTSTNNVWYGIANFTPAAGEVQANPQFVGQPGAWTGQAMLDNYNTNLTSGSPAVSMAAGAPGTIVGIGTTPPPTPTLTSIAVTPNPGTVTGGGTLQMTCVATYSDSSTGACVSPAWSSSGGHTSVNTSGLVTGQSAGTDTVTASISPISGNATVTVTSAPPPTLTSISVTPNPASVAVNASITMTCTAHYSDSSQATCPSPSWFSSGGHTTVNQSGLLTGTIAGTDTVTASIGPTSGNATVNVTGGGGGGGGGGQPIVVGGVQITPTPTVTVTDPRVVNGHVAFTVTTTQATSNIATVLYKNSKLKYLSCSTVGNGEANAHGLSWAATTSYNTVAITVQNALQPGEVLNIHVDCWTN
jgi:hypothetical protein